MGLLFFHTEPWRWFPATQVDVVWFPDGPGGDQFTEKTFRGPVPRMVREALDYIQRNYINEMVTGERTHVSRNPRIVRCLVDLGLMRDAGEGILRMSEQMAEQELPAPEFATRAHEVWVTLRNRPRPGSNGGEHRPDGGELGADGGGLTEVERELVRAPSRPPSPSTSSRMAWDRLGALHGDKLHELFLAAWSKAVAKRRVLDVLRLGLKFYGKLVRVATFAPAHGLNPDVQARYDANRLVVVRQLHHEGFIRREVLPQWRNHYRSVSRDTRHRRGRRGLEWPDTRPRRGKSDIHGRTPWSCGWAPC